MIPYQLANGKTVYLTVEEYLGLSDEQIQDLNASGYGEVIINPFHGSVIKKSRNTRPIEDSDEDIPDNPGFDFDVESDEINTAGPIDLNNIPDEDFPT